MYNEVVGIQYEYDLLFEDLNALYGQYESSPLNDANKPEYDCIVEFLKINESSIRDGLVERGLCLPA